MKLKNIVWTAVVATVAGLAGLIVAIVSENTDIVVALAGIAIASALLSARES
jgi:heme exporter protein D